MDIIDYSNREISTLNSSYFISELRKTLKRSPCMMNIKLSQNDITDEVLKDMNDELFSDPWCMSKINSIDLSFNRITSDGLMYLFPCFTSPTCGMIDLRYNYIDDSALAAVAHTNKLCC